MLEIFQIIILKIVSISAVVFFIMLIFNKKPTQKLIKNHNLKVQKVVIYILIGSIIVAALNINLQVIYLEIHLLLILSLLMIIFKLWLNEIGKFWIINLIVLFVLYVIIQFNYPFID